MDPPTTVPFIGITQSKQQMTMGELTNQIANIARQRQSAISEKTAADEQALKDKQDADAILAKANETMRRVESEAHNLAIA